MELTSMESTLPQMDSFLLLEMITVLSVSGETHAVSEVNQDAIEVTLSMLSVSNSAPVETDSGPLEDMIRQSCNTRLCELTNHMDGNRTRPPPGLDSILNFSNNCQRYFFLLSLQNLN